MNDIMKLDLAKIEEVEREIAILEENKREILEKFVADHAPCKLGDILVTDGYSHRGKRGRVEQVWLKKDKYTKKRMWGIRANILKQDGTVGLNTSAWEEKIEY